MTRLLVTQLSSDATEDPSADFAERLGAIAEGLSVEAAPGLCRDGAAALGQALDADPQAQVLVLYDPAGVAVARGLSEGRDPERARAEWIAQAMPVGALYRRARRRILFASLGAVSGAPEQLAGRVAAHFGAAPAASGGAEAGAEGPGSALERLLARQLVAASEEATRLDEEFEAGALSFGGIEADPVAACAELAALRARMTAAEDSAARFDARETDSREAEDETAAESALLVAQLSGLRKELSDRFVSGENVRGQLDKATKTLARHEAELETLRTRAEGLAGTMAAQEIEIHALRSSTSWKITAPLRGARRAVGGAGERDSDG